MGKNGIKTAQSALKLSIWVINQESTKEEQEN